MKLEHTIGESISLSDSGRPLWRYVYSGKPKPYFHPLCTPAGHVLTNFEPTSVDQIDRQCPIEPRE